MKYLPQNPRKGAGLILLGLMNRVGKWPTAWVIYWIPFTDFVNREQTTGESPKKGAGTTFFRSDQQIWDLVCVSYHNRRQSGKSSNKGRPDSTFNLLTSISCHQDQVIFFGKITTFHGNREKSAARSENPWQIWAFFDKLTKMAILVIFDKYVNFSPFRKREKSSFSW